jgi:hypothetical protein
MTGIKWAGILSSTLTIALIGLANVLLATLTRYSVPNAVNSFGAGIAAASAVIAFGAHAHARTSRKLDLMAHVCSTRLDDLQSRVDDYNTGFVEGYLLSQGREAPVAPLAQHHLTRRGAPGD